MVDKRPGTDPNKGLNTKVFLVMVIVALVIIIVSIFLIVASRGQKIVPKVNQPHPNSRLVLPASPSNVFRA